MPEWAADVALDRDGAAELIAHCLPELAGLPVSLAGEGYDNWVYRVGRREVVRIPRRALGASVLDVEVAVLPELAAVMDVSVPIPLAVGDPRPAFPYRFAYYRWLAGVTADRADLSDASRASLAVPLGACLAQLHGANLGPEAEAADLGDRLRRADLRYRRGWMLDLLEQVKHLGVDTAAVRRFLDAWVDTPPWREPPVWVHGDLYARHLLVDDTGELAGVIDWGDVHRGDPALDLSIGWSFLPRSAHDAFREAYGGVDEATWARARVRCLHYGLALLRYGEAITDDVMIGCARRALHAALDSG